MLTVGEINEKYSNSLNLLSYDVVLNLLAIKDDELSNLHSSIREFLVDNKLKLNKNKFELINRKVTSNENLSYDDKHIFICETVLLAAKCTLVTEYIMLLFSFDSYMDIFYVHTDTSSVFRTIIINELMIMKENAKSLSQNHFIFCICSNNDKLLDYVKDYDENSLNMCLLKGKKKLAEHFLNNKILPTNESFNAIRYWITEENQDAPNACGKIFLKLINDYGYKLTSENYSHLFSKGIILDIYEFGIEITDEFYNALNDTDSSAYTCIDPLNCLRNYAKNYPPSINVLQKACSDGNLELVKILVFHGKLKPDQMCIDNACKKGEKAYTLIKYLISKGSKPVTNSLKNYINSKKPPRTLKLLVENM
jgi:hypothetical protein